MQLDWTHRKRSVQEYEPLAPHPDPYPLCRHPCHISPRHLGQRTSPDHPTRSQSRRGLHRPRKDPRPREVPRRRSPRRTRPRPPRQRDRRPVHRHPVRPLRTQTRRRQRHLPPADQHGRHERHPRQNHHVARPQKARRPLHRPLLHRPQVRRRLHRLQPHPHPHRRHRRPHRLRRLRHHRARVQLERLRQHRRQRQSHPLHRRRPALHRPQLLRRRRPHLLRPLDLQVRTSCPHGSHWRTHHPPHRPRQLRLGRRQKLQHQRKNLPPRQQRPTTRGRKLDPARCSQTDLQILEPRRRRRNRSRRQTRLQSHRTP